MRAEGTTPHTITAEMSVAEVVSRFPQTIPVFDRYGVVCVGCSASELDTIAEAARAHRVDSLALLNDLNNACRG